MIATIHLVNICFPLQLHLLGCAKQLCLLCLRRSSHPLPHVVLMLIPAPGPIPHSYLSLSNLCFQAKFKWPPPHSLP